MSIDNFVGVGVQEPRTPQRVAVDDVAHVARQLRREPAVQHHDVRRLRALAAGGRHRRAGCWKLKEKESWARFII